MLKVAIYAKEVGIDYKPDIQRLFRILQQREIQVFLYAPFDTYLRQELGIDPGSHDRFSSKEPIASKIDIFISIGGDGTFLDAAKYVAGTKVPIIGFNTGRLGFLSRITSDELQESLDQLIQGSYSIEPRALLYLDSPSGLFGDFNFALNELTIHKNDTSSMIIIHTFLNDEFLNSYWADGLIIATPTGSTAYSMSCGGPIVAPGSNNFVITPVAPHNLNVRPIVVPDSATIRLQVEGRSDNFLVSLDSRTETISAEETLTVSLYSKKLNLIKLPDHSYLTTLRNKLSWGLDKRN